jgi:hypothetical protein
MEPTMVKVNFFNTPYLLYEGGIPARFTPDVCVTYPVKIGHIYSDKHHLSFIPMGKGVDINYEKTKYS